MKCHRVAKLLFFINLLYLHCLPNSCDIKQDAATSVSESIQSSNSFPAADLSRAKDVSTEQTEEAHERNLEVQKEEIVQPNVEYVNSQEKVEKQIVDRIGRVESLHPIQKPRITDVNLENSESSKSSDQSQLHEESASPTHTLQTEPLSSKLHSAPLSQEIPTEKPTVIQTASAGDLKDSLFSKEQDIHYSVASETDAGAQQYDGMPSFDEWKKMMLAEQEKGGQKVASPTPPGKKISSQKRRRNYSSYECGAKIVASNSEAEGTSRILNELVDEYMLNPCTAKIWFVIELCETVQASQIELANFELFSSCPKDFAVYSSDIFPTRDWVPLGTFTAAEQRVLQSFELKQEGFGKFIKIELLTHYGAEHYCPLSVVRIFGTSMVDEYEEMETMSSHVDIPDDDLDRLDIPIEDKKSTNIFGTATDAVMNIVKKAAQALGQHSTEEAQKNDTRPVTQNVTESKFCSMDENCSTSRPDLLNFSPASMPQSMFRLLHRCDQCVSNKIRYYSSAQPHCRFFQAALGPVMFQALCDWFREHPLAVAHESPAPVKDSHGPFVILPTKSPPPQIMRIPSEAELLVKDLLNDTLSSAYVSHKLASNATTLSAKANKSASVPTKIVLQSSIKPTKTMQNGHSTTVNESVSTTETLQESIIPAADSVKDFQPKASVTIPEKTEVPSTESATTNIDYSEITEEDRMELESADLGLEMTTTEVPPSSNARSESPGKSEPVVSVAGTTAGQKESVFMRMSNRIKALEINMSLSSQYLQELSQRYRKQMEEMQRAFNRTIGTLNDTARKAAEKDLKQQEILNNLQVQVANLSQTVEQLLGEKTAVFRQMVETHVCLMVVEAIVMIAIMSLCIRRISSVKENDSASSAIARPTATSTPSRLVKRRNSADSSGSPPPIARKVKKRSNSEDNLNSAAEDGLINKQLPVFLDPMVKAKKKNRKRNRGIPRSVSHPSVRQHQQKPSRASQHPHAHSDGCVPSRMKPCGKHTCENCDNSSPPCCTTFTNKTVGDGVPGKNRGGLPLQNLTNGGSYVAKEGGTFKDKFSLKKFLKLQKRDSI